MRVLDRLVPFFTVTAILTTGLLFQLNWAFAKGKEVSRQKVIDFEDEVVEGMNKRPLDSLAQISERDKKKRKIHLYRKRAGFRSETIDTIRELRFIQ